MLSPLGALLCAFTSPHMDGATHLSEQVLHLFLTVSHCTGLKPSLRGEWTEIQLNFLLWGTAIWLVFKETQLCLWETRSKKSSLSLRGTSFPGGQRQDQAYAAWTQGKGRIKALCLTSRPRAPAPPSSTFSLSSCSRPASHLGQDIGYSSPRLWLHWASQTLNPRKLGWKELTQFSTYLNLPNNVFHSSIRQAVVGSIEVRKNANNVLPFKITAQWTYTENQKISKSLR